MQDNSSKAVVMWFSEQSRRLVAHGRAAAALRAACALEARDG
jgi:hypothetical protein